MPTGYTAAIKDGITFETYALSCARAFGALVSMREEPANAQIPERFEPSSYNAEAIQKAKDRRSTLSTMSASEAAIRAAAEFDAAMASYRKSIQDNEDLRSKYESMLATVNAWVPPTEDHEELKTFMRQQINESLLFDCGTIHINPPKRRSGAEWLAHQLDAAQEDIAYHTKAHEEECFRVERRNEWVSELRDSLKTAA